MQLGQVDKFAVFQKHHMNIKARYLQLTPRMRFPGWGDTGSVLQDEKELARRKRVEMGVGIGRRTLQEKKSLWTLPNIDIPGRQKSLPVENHCFRVRVAKGMPGHLQSKGQTIASLVPLTTKKEVLYLVGVFGFWWHQKLLALYCCYCCYCYCQLIQVDSGTYLQQSTCHSPKDHSLPNIPSLPYFTNPTIFLVLTSHLPPPPANFLVQLETTA